MGKNNLLKTSLTAILLGAGLMTQAQTSFSPVKFPGNYYRDYVGTRLTITTPASVQGDKLYTISNDGVSTTGQWGKAIVGTLTGDLAKAVPDSSACGFINSAVSGKIAVVYRGNCEFGFKAKAVQTAGAVACIIINNVSGGPVGMGAGAAGAAVNIPVMMISKDDGDAIVAELNQGHTVSMKISASWGAGNSHDLGILLNGISISHSYALPVAQLNNNGNPDAYKNHDGAYIANFGTSTETNIKLKSTLSFTPTGGSTSVVRLDSVTVPSFSVADSIIAITMPSSYDVTATGTGRYDVTYQLSADNADNFTADNTVSYSFYATDTLYSKGRYDFVKNVPTASSFRKLTVSNADNDYTWGPLYYVANGGHSAKAIQFSVASGDASSNILSTNVPVLVYLFKWNDGVIAADSIIEMGELELKSIAQKYFDGVTDSSEETFYTHFTDLNSGNDADIPLDAHSWYWVAAEITGTPSYFLGIDGVQNYFPRSFVKNKKDHYLEPYASIISGNEAAFTDASNSSIQVSPFPFDRQQVDSVVYSSQAVGLVPAIPMIIGLFPSDVKQVNTKAAFGMTVYPNPATNELNVTTNFENATGKVFYDVIDGLGRHVTSVTHENVGTSDKYTLATDKLAAGVYYVSVLTNGHIITRKFAVTK